MKKSVRDKLILLAIGFVGLVVYAFLLREPSFKGRQLSAWLDELAVLDVTVPGNPSEAHAAEARRRELVSGIRAIGPRALPWLVRWVRSAPTKPMPLHDALERLFRALPRFRIPLSRRLDSWDEAQLAVAGFQALEASASPAVPQLTKLLQDPDLCEVVTRCLRPIGPAALPAFARALTNRDSRVRDMAIEGLIQLGARSGIPVPSLLTNAVSTKNLRSRGRAQSLALSLTRALDQPDPRVRLAAVKLLASQAIYGAVGLSRAARDRDDAVRRAAEAALARLPVRVQEGAIIRGPTKRKVIALVFTGHQYAEGGEAILDALARQEVQASFFLTGDFLANPAFTPLIQRILKERHYLGPHSDRHLLYCPWQGPKNTLITRRQFADDFAENLRKIENALHLAGGTSGPGSANFIPPYEHYNLEIVEWAANFNFVTVSYTPGTRATADYTGEAEQNFVPSRVIFDSIMDRERQDPAGLNGFILLFHLGAGPGRTDKFHAVFGELLGVLRAKGYRFVSLDELFEPQPYRDYPARYTPTQK